jgi:hypothetical protein
VVPGLAAEVLVLAVVLGAVFEAARPEVFAPVFEVLLFPWAVVVAPGPVVAFVVAAEPGVVSVVSAVAAFVAAASLADIAEPQASADIRVVFAVLAPVFGAAA